MRSRLLLLSAIALSALACEEDPPATTADLGPSGGMQLCGEDAPCPEGQVCKGGVCEAEGSVDAGPQGAAELQVCTPEGCEADNLRLDFGGARVGATTERRFTVRSVGALPVTLRSAELLDETDEFTVEPTGTLERTLEPGEEQVFRVVHAARDGQPDDVRLQIATTETDRAGFSLRLVTEYKGIPRVHVGPEAASTEMPLTVLDFGMVRVGDRASRVVYIKNRDRILDGSVLEVTDVRVDPAGGNFSVLADRALPALLNQFRATCLEARDCPGADDVCTEAGVCQEPTGRLVDILTATVSLTGINPGLVEETLVLGSNDGGAAGAVTRVLLRGEITFSELAVSPDPVDFGVSYVGFTQTLPVTVENRGTAPLRIEEIRLSGAAFALELGNLTFPLIVPPNETLMIEVQHLPTAVGGDAGTLTLISNDADRPVRDVAMTAISLIAPELRLSTRRIDFGDVHVQVGMQRAQRSLIVENLGGSELRVPSLTLSSTTPADFSIDPTSLPNIPPGGRAEVQVRYGPSLPTFPATQGGLLTIITNDPRAPAGARVGLSGRGVNPNVQVSVDSGPVGATAVRFNTLLSNPNAPNIFWAQELEAMVTIANSGFGPLAVGSLRITGDTRNAFELVGAPSGAFIVDQGQSRTFRVGYAAPSAGVDGAVLTISTNDLDLPGGQVSLSLVGDTDNCPAPANTNGMADATGACAYQCNMGWVDLDQDLASPTSNGCEYACTFRSPVDDPDDNFVDANCDGIDGDPARAVFVAAPPIGNDLNPGTRAAPLASLATAITTAANTGRAVYVAVGDYAGPLDLVSGVSIHGGYDPSNSWQRSTTALSRVQSSTGRAIRARNLTGRTILDRMVLSPGNPSTPTSPGPGSNSIGLEVIDSQGLEVRNCTIIAGNGSSGSSGGTGVRGADGQTGRPGGTGDDGQCRSSQGIGGTGGSSVCGATGGQGGNGGCDNQPGAIGAAGGGPVSLGGSGGSGGAGALVCDSSLCSDCAGRKGGAPGFAGGNGLAGAAGGPGAGGSGGTVVGDAWVGGRGATGGLGQTGGAGGGAGAGGGGADDCYVGILGSCLDNPVGCSRDRGGGGGGGGGGGCAGTGGTGGYGGGASFGIFLLRSNPIIVNNGITAGSGGRGGNGGRFGDGGSGGSGAPGGAGQDDSGSGGRGGDGGRGGRGGSGGGGAGGPSWCIFRVASSGAQISGTGCVRGTGGLGGEPGPDNTTGRGATGVAGTIN